MRYAKPITEILSVVDNNITYKKEVYEPPTNLTGVTDESYLNYNSSTTYNTGDYVIVPELKTIYRCASDSVSGVFPPSDPTKWVDWGFINSYRMLATDYQIGSQTEGTDIVIELPFNRCDVLGLINTTTLQVRVEEIDNDTNEIVYDKTISGRDIGCVDFAGYFYDEIREKTRFIIADLEWLPNATLRLTFSGDTKIGSVVIGLQQYLGCTLMGTSLSFQDKSKIKTDEFTGFREVIRYGHVRVLKGKLMIDIPDFNLIAQKISDIIGKNVLFIPDETDKFSEMTNIAYIEDFDMQVENPVKFQPNITLIGVS